MNYVIIGLVFLPFTAFADVGVVLEPLPCGIYDQSVKPLVEKDLETQNSDQGRRTMAATTKSGKKISVEVKSVDIRMPGERHQVSVFVDDKPYVKTSHQDVPLYLDIHVDNEKYRIICVRVEDQEISGTAHDGVEEKK